MTARKPTKLKVVQGTARASRVRKDEPQYAAADIGDPPPELTAEGLKAWQMIAPQLLEAGVLTTVDRVALRQLCDALGTYEEAHATIKKTGYFTKSVNGQILQSPAVFLRNESWRVANRIMIEFGMTPASRTKVGSTPKPKKGDDWNNF